MDKEKYIKEVDAAFEIFEIINKFDRQSIHRILSIMEQIKSEHDRQTDMVQKQVYEAGRPVVLK